VSAVQDIVAFLSQVGVKSGLTLLPSVVF